MPDTVVVRLNGRQAPGPSGAAGGCLLVFGLQIAGVGALASGERGQAAGPNFEARVLVPARPAPAV